MPFEFQILFFLIRLCSLNRIGSHCFPFVCLHREPCASFEFDLKNSVKMALFELCGVKNTRDAYNNVNPFTEMKLDPMQELKSHARQLDIDQAFIRAPTVHLVS